MLAAVFVLMLPTAEVLGQSLTASQVFSVGQEPFTGDDGSSSSAVSDLETRIHMTSAIAFSNRLENGNILSLSHEFDYANSPENSAHDRFTFNNRFDIRRNLGSAKKYQIKFEGQQTWQLDNEQYVFLRHRLGTRLSVRHNRMNTTYFRLRGGYRDQNDALFEGYDQAELTSELTHQLRPFGDRRAVTGTFYGDFRFADDLKYSYDEFGVRLVLRYPVNKDVVLSTRLVAFERHYDAEFSATYPVVRRDVRTIAKFQADYRFNDHLGGFAFVGWDRNDSNVPIRAYDGAIFGVGMKISADLWKRGR